MLLNGAPLNGTTLNAAPDIYRLAYFPIMDGLLGFLYDELQGFPRFTRNQFDNLVLYSQGEYNEWVNYASDAITLVDNFIIGAQGTIYSVVQDNLLVLIDEADRSIYLNRTQSEAVLMSDNSLRQALRGLVTADGLTMADSLLQFTIRGRVSTDALVMTDTFVKSIISSGTIYTLTKDNLLVFTDGTVRTLYLNRWQAETLVLSDGLLKLGLRNVTLSDGLTMADAIIKFLVRVEYLGDGIYLTDSFIKAVTSNVKVKSLDDALTLYSQGTFNDWHAIESNALVLTDSVTTSVTTHIFTKTQSDGILIFDFYAKARAQLLTDGIILNDVNGRFKELVFTGSDPITLSDGQFVVRKLARALSDFIQMADSFVQNTATIRVVTQDNLLSITDGVLQFLLLRRLLGDQTPFTDDTIKILNRGLALSLDDGLSLADYLSVQKIKLLDTPIVVTDASSLVYLRGRVLDNPLAALIDSITANQITSELNFLTLVDSLTYADGAIKVQSLSHRLDDFLNLYDDQLAAILHGIIFDVHILVSVDPGPVLARDVPILLGINQPPIKLGVAA